MNWFTYTGFSLPSCLPCCTPDCCYYDGTGSGDGGSVTGSMTGATGVSLSVTTTNSIPTLALNLSGNMALLMVAGATVVLSYTSDGSIYDAGIVGLTPDSTGTDTKTYTIPSDGCYIVGVSASTGPGLWTTLTGSVDVSSDLDMGCTSLADRGFTPTGGGGP